MHEQAAFTQCAQWIAETDGLLITAGAGMGVDSGLPDFRGNEGFWRAYPALGKAGMSLEDIASASSFFEDPLLSWGFYGHRLILYRRAVPHDGFRILRAIAAEMPQGAFVFTSNVDGQFQKAGFAEARVNECHGSIHWMQCMSTCDNKIWRADRFTPTVDESSCRLLSEPPRCPTCGSIARPNILMFNDMDWREERTANQNARMYLWLRQVERPVIVEIGAGHVITSIRSFSHYQPGPLIRINPRDSELPHGRQGVSLQMGAMEALRGIEAALWNAGFLRREWTS